MPLINYMQTLSELASGAAHLLSCTSLDLITFSCSPSLPILPHVPRTHLYTQTHTPPSALLVSLFHHKNITQGQRPITQKCSLLKAFSLHSFPIRVTWWSTIYYQPRLPALWNLHIMSNSSNTVAQSQMQMWKHRVKLLLSTDIYTWQRSINSKTKCWKASLKGQLTAKSNILIPIA